MMGRQSAPEELFYKFRLEDHVPADHLLRQLDAVLNFDKNESGSGRTLQPYGPSLNRSRTDAADALATQSTHFDTFTGIQCCTRLTTYRLFRPVYSRRGNASCSLPVFVPVSNPKNMADTG